MSSVLESLASAFGPDVVGSLGKALGAQPSAISRGLGVAGPLALSGMAKLASAPGGAESLLKVLPQDAGGLLGNLGGLLMGAMGGGETGANPAQKLLGPGVNAMSSALSRTLGFNAAPLLAMVVPAALGAVSRLVKSQNLDAAGLASLLGKEHRQFADDPANRETSALVTSVVETGNRAAATIASYGADWPKVVGGPVAALLAVAASDLSGPMDQIKEAQAAGKAMLDGANRAAPDSVLAVAFGGGLTPDMARQVKALAPTQGKIIDLIKAGAAAVAAKSPAEAQAYKDTILSVARATAEAAKEGGFLGIGSTLVSKDEQAALDAIKAALA